MTHVWNSKMGGAASMQVELLESIIPHDRRELALALFHENDYSINGKILLFGRRRNSLIHVPIFRRTSHHIIIIQASWKR